jgi:hypothetical protein
MLYKSPVFIGQWFDRLPSPPPRKEWMAQAGTADPNHGRRSFSVGAIGRPEPRVRLS